MSRRRKTGQRNSQIPGRPPQSIHYLPTTCLIMDYLLLLLLLVIPPPRFNEKETTNRKGKKKTVKKAKNGLSLNLSFPVNEFPPLLLLLLLSIQRYKTFLSLFLRKNSNFSATPLQQLFFLSLSLSFFYFSLVHLSVPHRPPFFFFSSSSA